MAILKNISKAVDAPRLANGRKPYAVLALPAKNKTLQKSFNNLPSVTVEMVQNISVLDIINHKYCLFINPEEALEFLKVKNTKKV